MDLFGKSALVTGGTKGIGAATAVELARRGADVAIVGRHDDQSARQTASQVESLGRRCLVIVGDMGKPDEAARSVQQTADGFGSVDVLVHSAGGMVAGGLMDVDPSRLAGGLRRSRPRDFLPLPGGNPLDEAAP